MDAIDGKNAEELPRELELDLLVDEELPEGRRGELLRSLDKEPGQWRDLSIRFLERQVERKSARQLMTGAAMGAAKAAVETTAGPANYKFPARGWFTAGRITAIAAGLLVAVSSALVTVVAMKQADRHHDDGVVAVAPREGIISTDLPASVMGTDKGPVAVQVSVSNEAVGDRLFPQDSEDGPGSRRSVVITPDGKNGNSALVIPVRNLQFQ